MRSALFLGAASLLAAVTTPVSATFTCIAVYVTTSASCSACGTVACVSASCVGTMSLDSVELCRGVPHKGIFAQQYWMLRNKVSEALPRLGTEHPQVQVDRFKSLQEWQTFTVCDSKYGTCASNTARQAVDCVSAPIGAPCWGGAIFYNDGQVAAAFIGSPMTSINAALQSLHAFASHRGPLADRVVRAGAASADNGEGDNRCTRDATKSYVSTDSGMLYITGCVEITIDIT